MKVKNFVVDKNNETKEFRYDYRGQSFSQAQENSYFFVLQMIYTKFLMHRWQNIRLTQV